MNVPTYPAARKVPQVDNYHGVMVPDPYRWLEDDTEPERLAWIAAQNAVTAKYLANIPLRCELRCRFEQLLRYSRYYDLLRRGPYLVFKKNNGLQNQLVLYVQQGLTGVPEVLMDPNELASDGTICLRSTTLSKDARYMAYGLSTGGVEWEEYFVKDMRTKRDLPDRLQWVKASAIAWHGNGFYYSRYPAPADLRTVLSARNEYHQVWYHHVGTPQSADTLVLEDPEHPFRLYFAQTTEDERFVVLNISDLGAEHAGYALWVMDAGSEQRGFVPLVPWFDNEFRLVDNQDGSLFFVTNRNALNRRLILIDPADPGEHAWEEVIPERDQPLELVTAVGGRLFALYRHHAVHRLYVFDRAGRLEDEISLPGIGLAHVFPGQQEDTEALWSFTSFTTPPTIFRYDIATRASSVFKAPEVTFNAADYETTQVFYPSKDGTRIPMFIVHQKGLSRDGHHPSLISGYGGNGFAIGPTFDPFLVALLERGVVYALAGLRGGGEYGEAWHHAGWREKKQNVFDDCIAAAEWLQAAGYTSRNRSALMGSSNGGLLVGAVMVQRPDLFKVALPGAGIMDMLRFQKFTLGWAWTVEYGSSDDPAMFPILLSYSPLHNTREGVSYPATLVTTYEDDDCVVPAHSFKFMATLQERGAETNPYLIRIEGKSGHGAVTLPKAIDEMADLYAFMLAHMPGTTEAPQSEGSVELLSDIQPLPLR